MSWWIKESIKECIYETNKNSKTNDTDDWEFQFVFVLDLLVEEVDYDYGPVRRGDNSW